MGLLAFIWGLVAGSAVFVGAFLGWYTRPPPWLTAGLMAFGSGILLSIVSFEIVHDAYDDGGLPPTAVGYAIGAILFAGGLMLLNRAGAKHRKRATYAIETSRDVGGIVALATILDSVPESIIVGLNFYNGEAVAAASVAAVFLSNIPEGMSSTARMRLAGYSKRFVFLLWTAVAIAGGTATFAGYELLGNLPPHGVALTQAIAGGALLVFIIDAIVPEAVAETREATGLIVALGFLLGFTLVVGLG